MQTVSRLITLFSPTHYTLSLQLHRKERHFTGIVTLQGIAHQVDELRLHAKGLIIASAAVDGHEATWHADANDELVVTSDVITAEHDHIVTITFSGAITDGMHGLYPCYFDHNGMKKELLMTQFESHHAREAFPCIDEPEAKATFDVTLTTEEGVTVLGNMPVAHQHTDPEGLVTTFQTTPRMSTYLLAWVVGELHKKTAHTKRGVEVSVWATPAQPSNSLDFALDIARRSIDFYEEYFDTNYPLPKSDHVAVPDFSSGAMENWGLITYREIALLAPPKTTSISSRQYIATVVAHELAHQWFGNLVTMRWWNDLWLNESFANMMEYLTVDALEPSWNMWLEFATNEALSALRRDSIDGVQSVQIEVNHPDEINTLFDPSIVYAKGGRLLYMLRQYVGNESFRAGLAAYFKEHAYRNTEGADLWRAIGKASGKDIEALMHTWISQPGYPVVSIDRHKNDLTIEQTRFFVGPHQPSDQLWPIPLDGTAGLPALLDKKSMTVPTTEPIQLNRSDSSYFITAYDDLSMEALLQKIRTGKLPEVNRLQLLSEATLLAQGGIIPTARLIDILDTYQHEASEAVWSVLAITLADLRKFVDLDSKEERALRAFTGNVAHKQYQRLGWNSKPNEPEADTKLRTTILSLMEYSEDETVLSHIQELYNTTPLEQLDPQLRSLIISSVVRHANEPASLIDFLLEQYKQTPSADLQLDITGGITSVRHPSQIERLLASIKDGSIVRPQDAAYWYVYLLRNRQARPQAWQWIRDNWQWIVDTFKGDKSYDMYPRYTASGLSTKQQLAEYSEFFTPLKDDPALTRVITMGISEIEGRVALLERDGAAVREKLSQLQQ